MSVVSCVYAMSAIRKLCSVIHKSSRSIVTLNKRDFYTKNYKTLSRDNVFVMTNCQNQNSQIVNQKYQMKNYSQALGSLMTKDQANDLVFRLNEEERKILYNTLEQFQMKEDKRKLECELRVMPSLSLSLFYFHIPSLFM